MHAQSNTARVLADARASLERIIHALDRVLLHREQEAGRELGPRRARVEERRRRVREVLLAHQFVGLDGRVDLRRFRVVWRSSGVARRLDVIVSTRDDEWWSLFRDSRTPRAHVLAVDADRDAHDHVLRPLGDVAVAAHEVGPLQSFEAEVVVLEVSVIHNSSVDLVLVRPAAGFA